MAADGAALFAQLQSVAGEDADADLYYDPDSGWDIDALLSDMSVYGLDLQATPPQQHAQGTPPPVTPPPGVVHRRRRRRRRAALAAARL